MPPRYTAIGQLITDDPEAASKQLMLDYEMVDCNKTRLAKQHGVDYATIKRWFRRLREAGFPVESANEVADR